MALAEKYHLPLTDLNFSQARFTRQLIEQDDPAHLQQVVQLSSTLVLPVAQGRAPLNGSGLELVPSADYPLPDGGEFIYLGQGGGHDYVAAMLPAAPQDGGRGAEWIDLRTAFTSVPVEEQHLMLIAQAIVNWRQSCRFCPRCGSALRSTTGGWVLRCVDNDHELFPRTDPAVIVAIVDDADRLLLGANSRWTNRVYSVLAGFVEAGESLESAVRREVFEESGVRVGDCAYRGSQPWPLPRSLMLGYTAHAQTTDLVPDGLEILDLRWFSREELGQELRAGSIQIPRGVSIAHALIRDWYGQELPEAADL
ncbi:NAD(+) diphosphatase [Glutamicibacter sp. MNS18]|uniref:NAD(+) diphosphatase n=1 Tax=Glutamicibacter sp. MNS18 TaxID=2989817 RepID=UPI002236603E|nr:NAD(+) diphosphatase [Glutamicibacter sp. MNS18]MCW4464364.1 NAD(+) diphosphatase [Glutamicibacter sp. MNS18]